MKAQALTVPNALSGLRLLLVPVIGWLIARGGNDEVAIGLLAIAGFSDWLDGFLARRWNQVSRLGVLLDPLADRLAIAVFVVALAARGVVPWAAVVLIVVRDVWLATTIPALRARGQWALPVTFIGKCATFGLLTSFPATFLTATVLPSFRLVSAGLLWISIAVYWWAGVGYIQQVNRLRREVAR